MVSPGSFWPETQTVPSRNNGVARSSLIQPDSNHCSLTHRTDSGNVEVERASGGRPALTPGTAPGHPVPGTPGLGRHKAHPQTRTAAPPPRDPARVRVKTRSPSTPRRVCILSGTGELESVCLWGGAWNGTEDRGGAWTPSHPRLPTPLLVLCMPSLPPSLRQQHWASQKRLFFGDVLGL